MKVVAEDKGKIYAVETIHEAGHLNLPFRAVLFPCLIWDHDGHFTREDRTIVARTLLQAGCRYIICGGMNCEAWHESVDEQFMLRCLNAPENVLQETFVMTTAREGETPDDAAFFFVRCTNFDHHDFKHYLVLHVGTSDAAAALEIAIRRYAFNLDIQVRPGKSI